MVNNIFNIENFKLNTKDEIYNKLISTKNILIERIISYGQKTPENLWLYEKRNEWVILLQGKAKILFENGEIYFLKKGDYINIKSNTKHKVIYTSKVPPCIWLAVYY